MLNSKYVADAIFLALLNSGEEVGLGSVNIKKVPKFFGYKFCTEAGLLLSLQFGIDLAAVKATTDHGG